MMSFVFSITPLIETYTKEHRIVCNLMEQIVTRTGSSCPHLTICKNHIKSKRHINEYANHRTLLLF